MTTEAERGTTTTEEQAKPKIEESPEFKEALDKAIRQGTSKYQRQVSDANKKVMATQTQLDQIQEQLAEARQQAEIARLAGDDEDAAVRVKRLMERERAAEKRNKEAAEREDRVLGYERRLSAETLHTQYGIPLAELEDLEDVKDMKIAALEWEREQTKKAAAKTTTKPLDEERESKPLDTGEGRIGTKQPPKPGTKEFEEWFQEKKQAAVARADR